MFQCHDRARFFKLLRSPGISSIEWIPTAYVPWRDGMTIIPYLPYRLDRAGIFKESMGAWHRGGIGLSYRPARLHRLAEFIP